MYFKNHPIKLVDSRLHGTGTELFIVEGDSAASVVANLRDAQFQAVLPMQGKPLNAIKASAEKAMNYPLFKALADSLGMKLGYDFNFNQLQFERVILLFDPDADGIHSGALMLLFFYQFMRPMLEAGKIEMIHAPWMQVSIQGQSPMYAFSEAQSLSLLTQLRAQGHEPITVRYRDLAGIDREILFNTCINPTTRNARVMSSTDALMTIEVFGGVM
ncbi:MAG: toprim domain-containing protein [Burkholderiales bacterium]|nr:toprim domain-containing protein [Burkholderiales bacterium]